ncbi:MAG TPA: DUF1015 family protein, partial [Kofleriaceae bacterium]|nr:DUF1015 family protein [Kofleriaceae bacterium]
MAQIAGFRGVLPAPAKLADVVAGGYTPTPGLAADGMLARDASRCVYRYHQVFAGPGRSLTRKSLFCAVQLIPFADGQIRPHEHVSPAGRDAALATIRTLGGHVDAVLLGFRDPATEVERLCRKVEATSPALELTVAGVTHKLWRISDAETIGALRRYFAPKKLHVLDGHDRYDAMCAHRAALVSKHAPPMYSSANYGLACLTSLDDPALAVAPRHRILRGAKRADLAALGKLFIVDKLPGAATKLDLQFAALADAVAHQPAMVITFANEPDAWKLTLSPDVSPVAEGVSVHRALQKLDPIVIQHLVIERAFAKAEVTTATDATAALAQLANAGADAV